MLARLAILLLIAAPALAQQTVEVTATWAPPTEGSPVVFYVLQLAQDGGPFETVGTTPETSYLLELTALSTYTARVAGVDVLDRQGPWSPPSDPWYADPGPPGPCGGIEWTAN